MKKNLLIFSCVCTVIQLYGLNDQEVLRTIVSNHTRALDRRNMYERPFDAAELRGWNQAVMNVKEFVEKNSKKEKKQLLGYFDEINNANNDLINGIKGVYGVIVGGLSADVREQFSKKFTEIDVNMKNVQKGLDWIASVDEAENKAIKVLRTLAQFVGVTARKADTNLTFRVVNG